MQTSIQQISPVEYELVIEIPAEELAPLVDQELRNYRKQVALKGFRPGKVPLQIVRKLFGESVSVDIGAKQVDEAFEREVRTSGQYDLVGAPSAEELTVALDKPLHARLRFGVRPEFDVKYPDGERLPVLNDTVAAQEVDDYIERTRRKSATPVDVEGPAAEDSVLTVDVQRLDDETGAPLIGQRDQDVQLDLGDEDLNATVRQALVGASAGDVVRVDVPHDHDHGHDEVDVQDELEQSAEPHEHAHGHAHTHAYEFTVKAVQKMELPEIDAEFARMMTKNATDDPEAMRALVEEELQRGTEQEVRRMTEASIENRLLALNPVPVPESVIRVYLDAMVKDFTKRFEGKVPEWFDEEHFRASRRDEAERTARWMFIRDRIIKDKGLSVTAEDRNAYYEKMAGSEEMAEQYRSIYEQMANLREMLDERLLSEKVYDVLKESFSLETVDMAAYSEWLESNRQEAQPAEEKPEPDAEKPETVQE